MQPPAAIVLPAVIGGICVISAYYLVFKDETGSYTDSRFWIGIPPANASSIIPLQALAAIGYVLFILGLAGHIGKRPTAGILSYSNGTVGIWLIVAFSLASTLWPFATRWYLDGEAGAARAIFPVSTLLVAAIAAILMVAGAFEGDMHWISTLGILMFANVVVLADAVGWNAKLLQPLL